METNGTVFDIDAYLLSKLGPRTMPLNWLIPMTAVYSVIFLTGIVGNVCTCVVISRNQYMQTATNCYLFNLAIADMLTLLLAMPPELYTFWQQYPWQLGRVGCWLRGMIPEATAYASILTIVTFSSERYVAICHPLHQQTRSKLSNAVRNIGLIWLSSALCALPFAFFTQVNQLPSPGTGQPLPQSSWCGLPFNQPQWTWEILMVCSTVVFFVVPVSVITALYVRIALALHQSRRLSSGGKPDREGSKARSRRVVIRMLAAVVIAFFVCWAPFHAQRLLFLYVTLYGEWTDSLKHINQTLFTLAGCFYYFNSTINPILYSVMSNRFRVAFREKLCAGPPSLWCICCCCFCCVKDFEKRSHHHQQQQSLPQALCRNSNSHSSVRSYVSYKVNNNNAVQRPRSLAVDYNPKLGVTLTCVHDSRYGNSLTVTPPPQQHQDMSRSSETSCSKRNSSSLDKRPDSSSCCKEEEDITVELDEAIRPELDRLEETAADKNDCISCTNCSLLFPPRSSKTYEAVDRTSTTDLSTTDHNDLTDVKESLV